MVVWSVCGYKECRSDTAVVMVLCVHLWVGLREMIVCHVY